MDITLRCMACGATSAQGGLTQLPTQEKALQLTGHNPGCPITREDHRAVVHDEEVKAFHTDEQGKLVETKKQVYSVLVFPAYKD